MKEKHSVDRKCFTGSNKTTVLNKLTGIDLIPFTVCITRRITLGLCVRACVRVCVHDWETGQSVVLMRASFQVQLQRPSHGNTAISSLISTANVSVTVHGDSRHRISDN